MMMLINAGAHVYVMLCVHTIFIGCNPQVSCLRYDFNPCVLVVRTFMISPRTRSGGPSVIAVEPKADSSPSHMLFYVLQNTTLTEVHFNVIQLTFSKQARVKAESCMFF
jgi:hypothetical protein